MRKTSISGRLVLPLFALLAASCAEQKTLTHAFRSRGIGISVQVSEANAGELAVVAATSSNVIHDILATLDREIPRLNQLGSTARIPLQPSTFRILDMGRYYAHITSNAYDYTAGPVQDLWEAGEPDPGQLIQAIARTGVEFVSAQDSGNIIFTRPDISIRLGRMAEAYAVDAAAAALRPRTSGPYFISSGIFSRSVRGFAGPPAIPLPAKPGFTIGSFSLVNHNALALRTLEQRPAVVDPRDGRPARGGVMAVVAGPLASKANALAEALLVLGPDEAEAILPDFAEYDFLLVTSLSPFQGTATETFLADARIAPQLKNGIEIRPRSSGLERREGGAALVEGLADDGTGEVRAAEPLER